MCSQGEPESGSSGSCVMFLSSRILYSLDRGAGVGLLLLGRVSASKHGHSSNPPASIML